jgi:hypothetical protein
MADLDEFEKLFSEAFGEKADKYHALRRVLRSETFGKEMREMGERSYVAHRVSNSKTYAETVHCVEKLAAASFRLFAEKAKEEQTNILTRVAQLSENLNKALGNQPPLVVALTLLTLLRAHEQLCNAPRAQAASA